MSNQGKQTVLGVVVGLITLAVFTLLTSWLHNPIESLTITLIVCVAFVLLLFPKVSSWTKQSKKEKMDLSWINQLREVKKRLETFPKTIDIDHLLSVANMLERSIIQSKKTDEFIPEVVANESYSQFLALSEVYISLRTSAATPKSGLELEKLKTLLPQYRGMVAEQLSETSTAQLNSSYTKNDHVLEQVEKLVKTREMFHE